MGIALFWMGDLNMIITLTMNPAMDQTIYVDKIENGTWKHVYKTMMDPGGKGINVSKTIQMLGGESIATGFLGGLVGAEIKNQLESSGIRTDFVTIKNDTRINLKIVEQSGCVTERNGEAPNVSAEEVKLLMKKIEAYASSGNIIVFSGSIPLSVSEQLFGNMLKTVKEKGAKVVVDTSGVYLKQAILQVPFLIKPNKEELMQLFEIENHQGVDEIIKKAKELCAKGIEHVIVSLGSEGALFFTKNQWVYRPALNVSVKSTVGAGDSMVAGFLYGINQAQDYDTLLDLAMATSAAAVTTEGTKPATKSEVMELLKVMF